ncbi:MAG: hypothetical protein H7144_04700 [Burkholderiales bacterium]|nr:hypothetical protein [Phycisphaerae bacterium]
MLNDLCERIDAYERATGTRVNGDELGLPYWAELWDSAMGVGQWLIKESGKWRATSDEMHSSGVIAHRSVLDLGCGLGLAGTVAAMLGAEVLFADIEPECLLFSLLNGLRYRSDVEARRVNWQTGDLSRRFDVILGSDILYDRSQWPFLTKFFDRHLDSRGTVLLGEPGRITGEMFVPWIQEQGWHVQEKQEHIPNRATPIRLFELIRTMHTT